ncbi:ABC transporter ATP-binding protein [Paenibacillus paeoniae]|uniref:ATP-binding cassette domain-containing protein n=1 Tax=Paenibacillus paeoniae TaxID=2292705 RepID=A0A371PIV1_9BACL|nr:ABC transporter ATP-binding protein [Paenibacillus paeoniae]REK75559.1 ATP-binding cassette domain-containing protein [Paenibacillus paeoniae]
MITFDNYSCTYSSGKSMLHQLNLSIRPGEFVFVTGPSGGGKSTLCFSINGLIPHETEGSVCQGSVTVDGNRVQDVYPSDLVSVVGTVLQDPEWQLVRGTVKEELTFALENMGYPTDEIDRRLEEVVDRVEIQSLLLRSTLDLSGGQKQRVAIAACLMTKPKVIVLDEPTAELDPLGKEMVLDTIRQLHQEWGYTIVFVDHNLDVSMPYVDRVIVVSEGKIVADAPPSLLYDDPLVREWLPMPQVVELARKLGVKLEDEQYGERDPLTVEELRKALSDRGVIRPDPPKRLTNHKSEAGAVPAGEALLELKNITFRYRKQEDEMTIKPLNLRIGRGEFAAVIGRNGAGKSTLCKLITGLLKPHGGELLIDGKPSSELQADQRARHIGFVFQNPDYQFVRRTVYDEVAYGLSVQKLPAAEIDARVKKVTKLLQIDKYLQEHPHFLSRGERRRVAIASILVMQPEVIILDEPTTGLDSVRCREMMDYITELWRQGHTIIMLTHDMRVVADYIPRTIVLSQGQIVWDAPTREVFSKGKELKPYHITLPPVVELSHIWGWTQIALTSEEWVETLSIPELRETVPGGGGVV